MQKLLREHSEWVVNLMGLELFVVDLDEVHSTENGDASFELWVLQEMWDAMLLVLKDFWRDSKSVERLFVEQWYEIGECIPFCLGGIRLYQILNDIGLTATRLLERFGNLLG